ncbi:MAG: formylglycine-generating enzyme family protein [Muribaculaceae bacterium]|nr:formylglycine-generating enzyme family protein [Muribaculaceae bacterium]MDE5595842.1 formylglycine-generating enzyme family protein [Muribaculaceae bacterium]MDE6703909.1 formylglycine-generating enzyme family protein [Muribaculaceae bacterium]
MQQLISLSKQVADGLLGGLSRNTGRSGNGYSAISTGGGQVETFTVNGVTFEMIMVDGGAMNPFYIGKTEVTQRLWYAVMGNNPSRFIGNNNPVEQVSWYDCQEFVERLSRLTGRNFRLPTDREWEYAARGGSKSRGYEYSGSNDIYRVAWYDENSGDQTHPVAQKLDNELSIYDMSGNVWEWCSDLWSSNSTNRVIRGGGWGGGAASCRVANRLNFTPSTRDDDLGLRLAL